MIHTYIYIYIYIYICIYIYIYTYVSIYFGVSVQNKPIVKIAGCADSISKQRTSIDLSIYQCTYISIDRSYIHIYIYEYIYFYICIYILRLKRPKQVCRSRVLAVLTASACRETSFYLSIYLSIYLNRWYIYTEPHIYTYVYTYVYTCAYASSTSRSIESAGCAAGIGMQGNNLSIYLSVYLFKYMWYIHICNAIYIYIYIRIYTCAYASSTSRSIESAGCAEGIGMHGKRGGMPPLLKWAIVDWTGSSSRVWEDGRAILKEEIQTTRKKGARLHEDRGFALNPSVYHLGVAACRHCWSGPSWIGRVPTPEFGGKEGQSCKQRRGGGGACVRG